MKHLKQAGGGKSKIFIAVLVLFSILAVSIFSGAGNIVSAQEYEPEAGDYQSIDGGNWDNPGNWEVYTGTEWIGASDYPGHEPGDYTVTVHSGHELNNNNISVLEFGDLIIYGRLSLTYADYGLTLNTTHHLLLDGGAIYWYENVELNLPADATLEIRNIKDESDQLIEGLGLYTPNNANNNMRIIIGDVDYAAATGEGNVICSFDEINESGGSLVAVATANPAEFEYDGSVLTTELTGNATGFGSDPVEAALSFSWTGTGPSSFSFSSSEQNPGEIALEVDGVTHAGEYIFTLTVTSEIIATGSIYSHSDDAVVTVNPISGELIVTGITGEDKEYDGTVDAIVDTSGAELVGAIPGDDVSLNVSGVVATFGDENVGNDKALTVTGLTLTGADAAKYTLIPPTVTANISPWKLMVTGITGEDKEYDGTTDATVDTSSAELAEGLTGEDVSLDVSGAVATFVDKNVGSSKAITVAGLTLTGADAGNYTVTLPAVTADITSRELTVTGIIGEDKEYDGTTDATIDIGSAVFTGAISGDDISLDDSGVTATFGDKNVGSEKALTVTGLILTGADAGNYSFILPIVTADIIARELTITADDCNKDSGDLVSFTGIEFTASGLLGSDTVGSVILTCSGADEDASVGTYAIVPSEATGAGLENYAVIYVDGTLTVEGEGGGGGGLAWWVILLIVLAALFVVFIIVWYIIKRQRLA